MEVFPFLFIRAALCTLFSHLFPFYVLVMNGGRSVNSLKDPQKHFWRLASDRQFKKVSPSHHSLPCSNKTYHTVL